MGWGRGWMRGRRDGMGERMDEGEEGWGEDG